MSQNVADVHPEKIGVVTVTYNSEAVLPQFFESLLAQDHKNFVLYAIDNASADASLSSLRAVNDPRVVVIANSKNLGVAEANNQGIVQALAEHCDYVLLLNNDVVFAPGLLAGLVKTHKSTGCDLITPKMMYFDQPKLIWYGGGIFHRLRGYSGGHVGMRELDQGQFDKAGCVEYAPTCCLLVKARVFDIVGLMDPKYFVYWDDTDFCFRAWRKKVKMWYEPSLVLLHKVSALTGGDESSFSVRMISRNKTYYLRKHFGLLLGQALVAEQFLIYVARLALRTDSFKVFKWRMLALKEGLQMKLSPDQRSVPN